MAQVTYPHHSPKQQRITQLPGENGFHARDGSLLRKKREQWEKEKAEAGQNSWFPFGDKRNKKVVNINSDKCQKEGNVDVQFDTSHNFQLETVQTVFQQSPPHFTSTNKQHSNYNNQNSCLQEINDNSSPTSTTNIYQPTLLPLFVDYSMTGHFHSQHQLIPTINSYNQHQSPQHQLFPLPNGLIPVQTSSFQNSMPITFSGPATTIIDPLFLPHKLPSVLQTPPYSVSSPDSGTSSSKGVIITSDEINPCISTEELLRKNTHNNNNVNSPNICWKEELDRQVEEKKFAELIEHEKRLSEQIALEREAKLKFEKEENERAAEEQKRVSKIEVRDNYNQACLNGLQRAQQEAEALKRAKLYRHILLDGQADLETSKQVLKIDDDKLVIDILRQLRELELQKSIERSEIKIRSNSPSTTKSPKHQNSSPNSTPKFIKNNQNNLNKEQHSFSRANSWNVKHSRTLPTNWTSHLPVPICQQKQSLIKQSGEKLDITTTHLSTLKPLTNENKNNKEKTPPSKGLFEQLTLRRPRSSFNNKKETISPSEITTSNMICAKQGVDIEIDYLNFDEGIINNCSTKNNKFNNSKISDQNENNFKNNSTKQENIYGISRSNILNGKSNENSSSTSTQSTNSPGSSTTSSTTSKESANVFKFRTLLSTPSGSQDDLFNNNNNSTPISITRSSKTKNNNNAGLTTMAPSPFSRKTSKDINSNKECIGIRQSLRSPTMRRLQESLQSLSTIDDENEVVVLEDNKLNVKSRSSTPKPFNCKNSQYRSFNMRRDNTTRSRQILDHLAAVRAQLKNSQAQLEKTISKQNLVDNNE